MERDFLGGGVKDSAAPKDEAGFLGGSTVHWPFSNKIPAMQQYLSFKAAQEERSKKIMFDHLSSPVYQPMPSVGVFNPMQRSPSVLVSQKHLGIDRQGIHQFQQPGYPALGAHPFSNSAAHHSTEVRMFPAVPHHSIPISTSYPFFKVNSSANGSNPGPTPLQPHQPFAGGPTVLPPGGGSMSAAFASRNTSKPSGTAAQLTIFYAGTISVYNDVPLEKAQAIMFLAANGSNMNSNVEGVKAQIPVAAPAKVAEDEAISINQTKNSNQVPTHRNATQPCSTLCSPMSSPSHGRVQSGSGYGSTDDLTAAKTTGSLVPTSQHEPPKASATVVGPPADAKLMPRAIPQARKASLARFLEKRKERVALAAPYPPPQKSPDCTSGFDGKSMTEDTAHSSTKEQSWRFYTNGNSSSSSNSPSTKLQI